MKIYIAGPYTVGDVAVNVKTAIAAANRILRAGHNPYVPHLTHFWHMLHPGSYEQWIQNDLVWLRVCDALVRLPGPSKGADIEVQLAEELHIAIFQGLKEFFNGHR